MPSTAQTSDVHISVELPKGQIKKTLSLTQISMLLITM